MRARSALIAVVILCTAAGSGAAELSLSDCIRQALASSPDLQAAAAEVAAARARLRAARAGRYGHSEYTQILGFVNEAKGDILDPPRHEREDYLEGLGPFTRLELQINIPLWTSGKLSAALEAAEKGLQSQQAQGESRRADVILSVKQLYYGLLLARQLNGVLHDMLESMDKAVATTQKRLDEGTSAVTEIDLLKLKIGRAKFAKGTYEVDASAELARRALARAIGLAAEADIKIAERKLEPAAGNLEPLETYLAEGLERRPEWQQLASGIDAQAAKVRLERAAYYPALFLSTGVQLARAGNRTEQKNPFAYDEFNYLRPVGVLGMRWDLDFFMTQARVEEARADLERLRAQQRGAQSGLLLEIRRAYSDVMQARTVIQASEEGRKAGRGLLILTVSNFDLGIGNAEDLFQGLGAYTESSSDYFRAVHDYNVALGALSKAVGKEVSDLQY